MGLYGVLDSADIQKQFFTALEAGMEQVWALDLAYMNTESNRETEEYNWLGQVPPMRQWVGSRQDQFFNKYALTIRNYPYETTVPVDISDSRRDKTGNISRRVGELAQRANTHWNGLGATLINNGGGSTSGLAYDGQYFFDTDHNESGSNQKNDVTATEIPSADVATVTACTPTEAANILNEAIGYFASLVDDQGEPINQQIEGVTVVCNRYTIANGFRIAANPTVTNLVSGATNPLRALSQSVSVKYSPRVTAGNYVEIFINEGGAYRPFIFQDEQGVEVQILAEGSDEAFHYDRYKFGVKCGGRGAGYGAWQKALRIALS